MNYKFQPYVLPTATPAPPPHPPPPFTALRFRIADYNPGLSTVNPSATQIPAQQPNPRHDEQPIASGSSLVTFRAAPDPPPPAIPPPYAIPPMLIHDPSTQQPYYSAQLLQQPQFVLQQPQPQVKRRKRKVPGESVLSGEFQPAESQQQDASAKKRRLTALKMSPEELKLEQARQIALRKDREAREIVQKDLEARLATGGEAQQGDGPPEPELTEEERVALEEEKARLEAEAKAAQEALDKQMAEQREALTISKLNYVLSALRLQNMPLDQFFHELCATKDTIVGYQASRTFGPKTGPEIVEAIMERRPKVYEAWLAEKTANLYAKEREKLGKVLKPDQRRAMKAIVTHMKTWGLQDEMEKSAPGIWSVLKSLEDVSHPE